MKKHEKKYIDAEHFDERVREAMGMAMDDLPMEYQEAVQAILTMLKTEPAADVQEVRHGHWKNINRNKYNDDEATCSVCGATFSSGYSDPSWWDYCPNCGAKMDEVEE